MVHGYHYGIEDEAIYLPAIKKNLNPALYPTDSAFFLSQTNLTVFPNLIAFFARVTHLSIDTVVFAVHILSIFLTLTACWYLSRKCFAKAPAQWTAVLMVAAVLTIPVAGTSLYLMDQHLHPRSLATAALLFGLSGIIDKRYIRAVVCLAIAFLMHPIMGSFGIAFAFFLLWRAGEQLLLLCIVPPLLLLSPLTLKSPSEAWHEAVLDCPYYFLLRWEWYEWIGIFAPIALLAWFGYLGQRDNSDVLRWMSWRLVVFSLFFFVVGAVLTIPARFERMVSFQPMRWLHLTFLIFFLLAGGLLGQGILRNRPLRWLMLFVPLCTLMFLVQRQQFPSSAHIEWPGSAPRSDWLKAFAWVRQNTPPDAKFALDPHYLESPGLDYHGFRALAERSMLADRGKDRTVTTLTPAIAETWHEQVKARDNWKDFRTEDFHRLKQQYGVTWVVLERGEWYSSFSGLACLYNNDAVSVCRID